MEKSISRNILLPLVFSILFHLPVTKLANLFFANMSFAVPPNSLSIESMFKSVTLFVNLLYKPSTSTLKGILKRETKPKSVFKFPINILHGMKLYAISFRFHKNVVVSLASIGKLPNPLLAYKVAFTVSFFLHPYNFGCVINRHSDSSAFRCYQPSHKSNT